MANFQVEFNFLLQIQLAKSVSSILPCSNFFIIITHVGNKREVYILEFKSAVVGIATFLYFSSVLLIFYIVIFKDHNWVKC